MAILKSEIRNKFTTIPNSIVKCKDLSDGDYRLLIYLYSLPNAWKINQAYLGQELGCARENINKKIARIKEAGYLEITKNSEDKEVDYIYTLKEKDVTENITCDNNNHNPLCQQVSHVIPSDVIANITHINTNIKNTDNIDNNKIKNNKNIFIKPTLEELKEYCDNSSLSVDCQYFYDYYESNGWLVGKNKMKDWKATLRNWNRRNKDNLSKEPKQVVREYVDEMGIKWQETNDGKRTMIGVKE